MKIQPLSTSLFGGMKKRNTSILSLWKSSILPTQVFAVRSFTLGPIHACILSVKSPRSSVLLPDYWLRYVCFSQFVIQSFPYSNFGMCIWIKTTIPVHHYPHLVFQQDVGKKKPRQSFMVWLNKFIFHHLHICLQFISLQLEHHSNYIVISVLLDFFFFFVLFNHACP